MIVTLKNTGMIKKAVIHLEGLTVITGENDIGKSTIGKLMYSVIKTFNRYERDAGAHRLKNVLELIDQHYLDFRKRSDGTAVSEMGAVFFKELKDDVMSLVDGFGEAGEPVKLKIADNIKIFDSTIQRISGITSNLDDLPEALNRLAEKKPPKTEIFQSAFSKYISSIFHGQLLNKFSNARTFSITGEEAGNEISKKIFKVSGNDEGSKTVLKEDLYLQDATFIESPVLLNAADAIRVSKTVFDIDHDLKRQVEFLEKSYVPEYMKDFILKVTDIAAKNLALPGAEAFSEMINGNFYYDRGAREFVFKKDGQTFKGQSIAQGVKYIGMMEILAGLGFLGKKSLLILDEPENHIHPQWQIKFAEIMVKQVKEGATLLLTTHSPYLVEALKLYADEFLEKDKMSVYLGEKAEKTSGPRILDVTHDISPVFELLAKPYKILDRFKARTIL